MRIHRCRDQLTNVNQKENYAVINTLHAVETMQIQSAKKPSQVD